METMDEKTIADFGDQWSRYTDNDGLYGSQQMLEDICAPLVSISEFEGARIAEIGAGTGRITNMLLDAGAAHVTAIEPSTAYEVLVRNTENRRLLVTRINEEGSAVGTERNLDFVVSIGVLHHVADPGPIVEAARNALKPGGTLLIWLYGMEGNEAYVRWVQKARRVTTRIPHFCLAVLAWLVGLIAEAYVFLSRYFNLPMRNYVLEVFAPLSRDKRRLVIYDQLNPAYAKYYTESEARRLVSDSGFVDVRTFHRHGYSWSVVGKAPSPNRS